MDTSEFCLKTYLRTGELNTYVKNRQGRLSKRTKLLFLIV